MAPVVEEGTVVVVPSGLFSLAGSAAGFVTPVWMGPAMDATVGGWRAVDGGTAAAAVLVAVTDRAVLLLLGPVASAVTAAGVDAASCDAFNFLCWGG